MVEIMVMSGQWFIKYNSYLETVSWKKNNLLSIVRIFVGKWNSAKREKDFQERCKHFKCQYCLAGKTILNKHFFIINYL